MAPCGRVSPHRPGRYRICRWLDRAKPAAASHRAQLGARLPAGVGSCTSSPSVWIAHFEQRAGQPACRRWTALPTLMSAALQALACPRRLRIWAAVHVGTARHRFSWRGRPAMIDGVHHIDTRAVESRCPLALVVAFLAGAVRTGFPRTTSSRSARPRARRLEHAG